MQKQEKKEMYNNKTIALLVIAHIKVFILSYFLKENNLFLQTKLNPIFLNFSGEFDLLIKRKKTLKTIKTVNPINLRSFFFSVNSAVFIKNKLLIKKTKFHTIKSIFPNNQPKNLTRRVLIKLFKVWKKSIILKKKILVKRHYYKNKKLRKKLLPLRKLKRGRLLTKGAARVYWLSKNIKPIGLYFKKIKNILRYPKIYNIFYVPFLKKLLKNTRRFRKKEWLRRRAFKIVKLKGQVWDISRYFYGQRKRKNRLKSYYKSRFPQKTSHIPRKNSITNYQKLLNLIIKIKELARRKKLKLKLKTPIIPLQKIYSNLYKKKTSYLSDFKLYYVTFKKKKSNYYITVFSQNGEVVSSFSSGQVLRYLDNKRNAKTRKAYFNVPSVINFVSLRLKKQKIYKIKGFIQPLSYQSWALKKFTKNFRTNKIKIMNIYYEPTFTHGLEKKKKKEDDYKC